MKKLIFALMICVSAPNAMADLFYKCQSPDSGDGGQNFDPDILANGRIYAVLGSEDYEVAETVRYVIDRTYTPRTRTGFIRYLPTKKEGGIFKTFPSILVEKTLVTGSGRPDRAGNIGTIYTQYSSHGEFSEYKFRCQKSDRRNVDD